MKLTAKTVGKGSLFGLCVGFCAFLVIPWLGWPWHIIHGSTIQTSGVLFEAPPRYFSLTSTDDHPSVMRCDFGIPLWRAPYGFIEIFPHPNGRRLDMETDLDRLQAILVNQERSEGMSLNSRRKMATGVGPAFCFEFESGMRSIVKCYFDKSRLSVEYEGSQKFAGDVYEIVNSARRQGAGPPFPPE